jgi:GGDEF domain-containing protein
MALTKDPVSDVSEARVGTARIDTLRRARRFIRKSGYAGAYLEIDIRNLSGLNAVLGHSGANEVYGRIAAIIREELQKLDADVSLFRHGGDEMSAVVVGADAALVEAAMKRAQQKVADYVGTVADGNGKRLSEIRHPKHPDDPSKNGTGFTFAAEGIDRRDIRDIIAAADRRVELRKLGEPAPLMRATENDRGGNWRAALRRQMAAWPRPGNDPFDPAIPDPQHSVTGFRSEAYLARQRLAQHQAAGRDRPCQPGPPDPERCRCFNA